MPMEYLSWEASKWLNSITSLEVDRWIFAWMRQNHAIEDLGSIVAPLVGTLMVEEEESGEAHSSSCSDQI